MRNLVIASVFCTALIFGGAHTAIAAPNPSSASGTSSPARSSADRQFLRESYYEDASYSMQNAVIELARTECDYLNKHGNTAGNRIYLADETNKFVDYPFLFLGAAVEAYCPWNRF
ncbi:DUF732 domain-containing protein [Nocardia sp. NPDC049220]|uniref:DUF732 domain-containing protein n=1 Tax=Nocardia sp. NPDC049220 TaxID=3155273 RepID=UPI0033C07986